MAGIIETKKLDLWYGEKQALHSIDIEIPDHQVTALIGPSGCGKSTFLKTLNRMNDLVEGVRIEGLGAAITAPIFLRPGTRRDLAAPPDRHGVPEGQSLPHEHLRQHRLRPPHPRHHEQGASWTTSWSSP